MFAIGILLCLIAGLGLLFAVLGLALRLLFGLIGGVFVLSFGLVGVLAGGLALLIVAPLLLLAALPMCLPLLLVVALVWALTRAARRPVTPAH